MSRRRLKLPWIYDAERQEFVGKSGTKIFSVLEIATMLQDRLTCRYDFVGEWSGWRMRSSRLIPPGGSMRGPTITIHNAAAFARSLNGPDQAAAAPRRPPAGQPHLRLVYTNSR